MRIQDANIIGAEESEECTPFDETMDGEIVSIIQNHIAQIPDKKNPGNTRMMHTILVKHQNGVIRKHFAPGVYGSGSNLRIENFFKLYPDQVMDCKLVTKEIETKTGSFFRWILEALPEVASDTSDPDWLMPDNDETIAQWSDQLPDHDASLPGAVGSPITDTQAAIRRKRQDTAF